MTNRFGDLRTAYQLHSNHLHTKAPVQTPESKSAEPSSRRRVKKSSLPEKTDKSSPRKRVKKCKSLVRTDIAIDQLDYFRKITKLIGDEKRKNSLLVKTMKELLDTISNSREQLQQVEPWFWDLVESDQKRQLLVKCAIEGLQKAGIFSLLADGNCTLGQLVKGAPDAKNSNSQGVYARLYLTREYMARADVREILAEHRGSRSAQDKALLEKDKLLAQQRSSFLYVGSSGRISSRMGGHDHFLAKKHTDHARAYSDAIKKSYLVLCDLNDNVLAQQDARIRLVVEQMLVTLLGTYIWTPDDLTRLIENPQSTQSSPRVAPDDAVEMAHLGEEGPGESGNAKAISQKLRDKSVATSIVLANIGLEVCAKRGWQPRTARSDLDAKFGSELHPLNWFSPIDTIMKRPEKVEVSECETTELTVYRNATLEAVVAADVETMPADRS